MSRNMKEYHISFTRRECKIYKQLDGAIFGIFIRMCNQTDQSVTELLIYAKLFDVIILLNISLEQSRFSEVIVENGVEYTINAAYSSAYV